MLTQNGDAGHGVAMGNATLWDNTIQDHPEWGYVINSTPAVGAIAQWEGDDSNPNVSPGHVAYVESVSGSSITVSEDNVILNGLANYRWRTITANGDWPTRFLHIADVDSSQPGTLWGVDNNGHAVRYAGNAAWTNQGGPTFTKIAAGDTTVVALSTNGGVVCSAASKTTLTVLG